MKSMHILFQRISCLDNNIGIFPTEVCSILLNIIILQKTNFEKLRLAKGKSLVWNGNKAYQNN